MQKGDYFVYYGKTESLVETVDQILVKSSIDLRHGVRVERIYIISVSGKTYDSRDCAKITGKVLPNFIRKLRQLLKRKEEN
jgi:hypothetical protein